jgi:TRAP-type C4-dicarboxylate transport system permease small subunit
MRVLRRLADAVMALLMAVTFGVFLLQVLTRYLAKYQMGGDFIWTLDLTSSCFLWIIFFGGAFVLTERDHVKFDMFYNMFGPAVRRIMAIFTALAIVALFAWSLPGVWDYLSALWRFGKPNSTLKIPFSGGKPVLNAAVYSIYLVFALAMIVRYGIRAVRLILGATPDNLDLPAVGAEGT